MRVLPFRALRPLPEYAGQAAAPPYDVLSSDEAREAVKGNPYSFLHVDKAEIDLAPGVDPYSPAVYAKARENLERLSRSIYMKDERECLYIYRLAAGNRRQTGLACCVDAGDYENGLIKRHELTKPDKERDRVNHILACGAHTGPILMAHKTDGAVKELTGGWAEAHPPLYDFTAGGARHTVWAVNGAAAVDSLIRAFEAVPCFYIADGHHRSAAACAISKQAAGGGERGRFLAVVFPQDELAILDYNRVVKDLHGHTPETFLRAAEKSFIIRESETPVRPAENAPRGDTGPRAFGLYMAGKWYALTPRTAPGGGIIDSLAVSVLQNLLLAPILGIIDSRTDKRVDFVGGARGVSGLTSLVDGGEWAAAFTLPPTMMDELMAVADAGLIMPPKSTWFEPKLLSGLLIHNF